MPSIFAWNSINIHLLFLVWDFFLHAEFISAFDKNSAKSFGFHENAKIIENHNWFLLIVWDFHWNSWADCHKKSIKILFLDGKEDK